ncbi:TPA: Leucine-rich repeat serine/threonine-protein kinase 2 [Trebouxia sp. C0004]
MPGPTFSQEAPAAQQTADSTPEPSFRQGPIATQPDPYARHITQEGVSVQTLQPPVPDAAQTVAGRLRRARAALEARTRQMHGPLPMLPRKLLPRPASPAPATLEGLALLQAAQVELPDEVDVVRLHSRGINCIQADEVAYFCNLRHLDLSGNQIASLQPLATLAALHTLLLPGNCVTSLIDCPKGSFASLEVLDLSFNGLQPECLPQLGQWPQLRQLDMSGNRLGSWTAPEGSFPSLRVLKAAQCSLQAHCLHQLAALPCLTDLCLAGNHITKVHRSAVTGRSFTLLQRLDLTANRIATVKELETLINLPSLQQLVLVSNPVAARSATFIKTFSNATLSTSSILITRSASSLYQTNMATSPLIIQLQAEAPQTPLIAHCLPPDLPRVADLPLQGVDVTSGALAFEFSHDRIAEAFDRLQDDIQLWSSALVDSADAASPSEVPHDLHMLQQQQQGVEAGVGGEGRGEGSGHDGQGGEADQSAASEQGSQETASTSGDTETYSHIRDPSVKLAVALGLDPGQLAIYRGRQGTDSASAVAALQFALSHPLTEADKGLQKMPHFHTMTRSIAAKQRSKVWAPDVQQPELPLSFKMDKINTIEGILSGMKSRILGLEKNLVSQLDLKKQAGFIPEKSLVAAVSGNTSLAMPPQQ